MIGILGGTFDPVHKGHIQLAQQAITRLHLDEVQFMPCANPVHRQQPMADTRHRLKMIELALAGRPRMHINTLEIDRGGPSYMVDSLRQIISQQKAVLCLLVGVDAFNGIQNWKFPDEILGMAHLIVCRRPGLALDQAVYPELQIDSANDLHKQASGFILSLDIDENTCSSTEVRKLLAKGQSAENCLQPSVIDYINDNHLYEN